MMNLIFPAMVIISFASAIATGRMAELSAAVVTGGSAAVDLLLTLVAVMCFWGGVMEIAEQSGMTKGLSRLVSPLLRFIFPRLRKEKYILEAISLNVSANMLGLGNAATPLGIESMKRLQEINPDTARASDEMVVFVVMNTAAMRIIPTTVAALRGQYGSAEPMAILLPSLLTSASALAVGLTVARLGCLFKRRAGKKKC
ncbi:MAG: spore maturation protein A [Clostridia bacterium]|nr:spore maturation protein A [Clostridia bacterium]